MKIPFSYQIACARGEILNAVETIRQKYELPACIIDGVLSSVISDIRSEEKMELLNAANVMLKEREEELEKAKKEAKKVLKNEPDDVLEADAGEREIGTE